jgi:transposase-like protein
VSISERNDKSNDAARAQRLEIFTGAGRRRSWTAEQKASIVAESFEDGAPVSHVARRHGLTPQQLFAWRREARCRIEGPSTRRPSLRSSSRRRGRWVDSDAKCNPVDSVGSSTKSRVSHSEGRPSVRFPGDKDGSARRNIEPLQ